MTVVFKVKFLFLKEYRYILEVQFYMTGGAKFILRYIGSMEKN